MKMDDHNGNKCFHFLVLSWYFNVFMYFNVIILVYKINRTKKGKMDIKCFILDLLDIL